MKSAFGTNRGATCLEVTRGVLTIELGRRTDPADLAAHISGLPADEQVFAWELLGEGPSDRLCDVFAHAADLGLVPAGPTF